MRRTGDSVTERLRTKRLQEYKISYDKEARMRTKIARHTPDSNDDDNPGALDEELQACVAVEHIPTLYIDTHGNTCRCPPLKYRPDHWVSLRANTCTPLFLTQEAVTFTDTSIVNQDILVTVVLTQADLVPISHGCIFLAPSSEAVFIESLNFLILHIRILSRSTKAVLGEVTARPFAGMNIAHAKLESFKCTAERYPIVRNSEIVGNIELRLEKIVHDYTVENVEQHKLDSTMRRLFTKDTRRIMCAQTQTTGYLKQTLDELIIYESVRTEAEQTSS